MPKPYYRSSDGTLKPLKFVRVAKAITDAILSINGKKPNPETLDLTLKAADVGAATPADVKNSAFPTTGAFKTIFETAAGGGTVELNVPETGYVMVDATNLNIGSGGGGAGSINVNVEYGSSAFARFFCRYVSLPDSSAVALGPVKLPKGTRLHGDIQCTGYCKINLFSEKE